MSGCTTAPPNRDGTPAKDSGAKTYGGSGPIKVTVTTGMIADIVQNVGGDHVAVTGLMGPGVDPHLYKASQSDIATLTGADIIFYNGLHLEGKIGEVLGKMGRRKPVVAVCENIDPKLLRKPAAFAGHPDPHVWFDVSLWMKAAEAARDALARFDPAHRDDYQKNATAYLAQLKTLHVEVKEQLATIPKQQRVLVTAHDAFGYFGRAYAVEVVGLQGISTAGEYGLKDVQRLVDLIVKRSVKAVFVESSVSRRSIDAVVQGAAARGHKVAVGGTLFSDAMGAAGTPEGTYMGMVRANVNTIVKALK